MSERPDLERIDERGRAAAAGLNAAVVERAVPDLDLDLVPTGVDEPAAPSVRRRGAVLLGVAAAVVLVVAGIALLVGRGDDRDSTADRIGTGDPGLYVLGSVPDGFAPRYVSEATPGVAGAEGPPSAVYGPDGRPKLAVGVIPDVDDDGVRGWIDGLPEVDLGDRTAWDAEAYFGGGTLLVDVDGTLVHVVAATVDEATLGDVARAVAVDGDRARLPESAVPAGWEHLGDRTMGFTSMVLAFDLGGVTSPGAAVAYTGGGDGLDVVVVSSGPGDDLTVLLPNVYGATEDVEVRGHGATLQHVTLDEFGYEEWRVRWQERPGEIVDLSVSSTDFDRDDVLALAEGVHRADSAERRELVRATLRAGADDPGVTVLGEGRFSDGSEWVLLHGDGTSEGVFGFELRTTARIVTDGGVATEHHEGGSVTTVVEFPEEEESPATGPVGEEEGGPGDSYGSAAFPAGVSVGYGVTLWWSYGEVAPEVIEVQVVDADTGEVVAVAEVVGVDGVRGYVAELPSDLAAVEIRAVGSDGTVLDRYSFAR